MAEHVILVAGPMGAGKTTAIRALSEIDVVSTEAANSERNVVDKATTTVALDYGEITVGADDKVRLYGVPGQKRFDFMWTILQERAKGLLLLVNADAEDPVADVAAFLDDFAALAARGGVVIGVTRSDLVSGFDLNALSQRIGAKLGEASIPVLTVDPRDRDEMATLLLALVANIEMRELLLTLEDVG